MLQNTAINGTIQFGNIGNGSTVRAISFVARGRKLAMRKHYHSGKPLSESCRPHCCDWSASSPEDSTADALTAARLQPVAASMATVLPASAWAALVVQHAIVQSATVPHAVTV